MARTGRDKDLLTTLRESGLRNKVARGLSDSAAQSTGRPSKAMRDSIRRLRDAASALERSADGSSRDPAATRGS